MSAPANNTCQRTGNATANKGGLCPCAPVFLHIGRLVLCYALLHSAVRSSALCVLCALCIQRESRTAYGD